MIFLRFGMAECDNLHCHSVLQKSVFVTEENKLKFMRTGELAETHQPLFCVYMKLFRLHRLTKPWNSLQPSKKTISEWNEKNNIVSESKGWRR